MTGFATDENGTNRIADLYEFCKNMMNVHHVLNTMMWQTTNNINDVDMENGKNLLHYQIESAQNLLEKTLEIQYLLKYDDTLDTVDSNFQTLLENMIKETENTINFCLKFIDIVHGNFSQRSCGLLDVLLNIGKSFFQVKRLATKM
jgi:hypothetical protein